MDAFLLYIDDWLGSTNIELMDAHEERGYLRLLLHAAKQADCGLPNDPRLLARLSKLGGRWPRSGQVLMRCFFERDGRIYNQRLLEVQAQYLERKARRQKAAEERWKKAQQKPCNADAMHEQCSGRTDAKGMLPTPIPIPTPNVTTKPETPMCSSNSDEHFSLVPLVENVDPQTVWFSEFWGLYWRKRAKKAALAAFQKKIKTLGTWEVVRAALLRQKPGMMARDPETRPHAATWLNGERWNDEEEAMPTAEPRRLSRADAILEAM